MLPLNTLTSYGTYSVIGPVKIPLTINDGKIVEFTHQGFKFIESTNSARRRYSVLSLGEIKNANNILVRVSSNCQWAFYFDSQLCDCRWQLEEAKQRLAQEGSGILIFAHDQNGKGIPLEDHWLIYAEGQQRNCELVVDAYTQLGFKEDYRDYGDIVTILKHYGIDTLRLLTNSPRKKEALEKAGIHVSLEQVEQPIHTHLHSEYSAKKRKLGHWLTFPEEE